MCVWFQCVYSLVSMFVTVYFKNVCERVVSCESLRVFVLKRTWFTVECFVHKCVSDYVFSCKCIFNCVLHVYMYVLCVSEYMFSLVSVGQ